MNIIILSLLFLSMQTYIVEMETESQNKTCISEMFNEGEPISIRAKATNPPKNRYALYITVENEANALLTHKRHEYETNNTVLTYNNEIDQNLSICIDNFEAIPINVELDIRFKQHLANLDTSPTASDYKEIEDIISDVTDLVQRGYSYFMKNEHYVDEIVQQGTTLENSLAIMGVMTLAFMMGAGLLQVVLIRTELKNKKIF